MSDKLDIDKELLVDLATKLDEYIELLIKMDVCDLRVLDMGIKPISMNLAISPENNHLRIYMVGQFDDIKNLLTYYVVDIDTLKDQIDEILDKISENISNDGSNRFNVLMSLLDDWYQNAKVGEIKDDREESDQE